MTPKEKAQELIDKMSFETHKHNAKHCALTAVDEITEQLLSDWGDNQWRANEYIGYWIKVKQEIEKL